MSEIELDIELILSWLIEGETYRSIATHLDVALSVLHRFTSKEEHSARVREALQISGDSYADKAEQVLLDCDGTKEGVAKARELAQHYRWKAAKRYPKRFGDKLELSGDPKNPILPVLNIQFKTEADGEKDSLPPVAGVD